MLILLLCSEETDWHFDLNDGELLDVIQKIIDISTDAVITLPFFELSEDYLIIADSKAFDKGIHIFGREDFFIWGLQDN